MSKEIEVYNTYFGECIVLKEKKDNSNLLVDFGIHYFSDVSIVYGNRSDLTREIADDICVRYSKKNISLLITHFHEDHISGLIHMFNSGQCKYKDIFKNIYIANIWNNPFEVASNILEELLLEIEMRMSGLPRTSANLFDLLLFLSQSISKITLLSRGETFENEKYITLWPVDEVHENHVSEIINGLHLPVDFEGKLIALSEIVCIFVTRELMGNQRVFEYHDEGNDKIYTGEVNIEQRIEDMRVVYRSLLEDIIDNTMENEQNISGQIRKLNKLNHEYNVVFQNKVSGDENVLFTGDIEVSHMQKIESALDIKLHKQFKYIKVPHHGTKQHYFDYSKYNPQNIIISNGKVNTKNSTSYKICVGYGTLTATYLCTNSNNCCNCTNTCTTAKSGCAKKRTLVYDKLYKTI